MKKRTKFFCFMLSALMILMSSVTVFAADSEESSLSATLATAEKVSGMVSVSAPYPFEFIVSTTNENTAFISFVPDVDTEYTFYLGVKGQRQEIFKINRTQYMVEAGVEYSFAYSYTVGDDMTVYNGTLLVTADDAGITVTPTGVVRNITYAGDITEAVKASYFAANTRASGTANESESNNTMATADITYDGYDSYGTLSSTSDVDWWKVSFTMSGTANFWLGNIPSGCNYDISVYSQAGMLLGESYNSGTTAELVQVDVTAGTFYYIKVESTTNASSSQYLLRAYSVPGAILSVPLYVQQTEETCSCASGRMVLKYYGVTVSEDDFKDTAINLVNNEWRYAYAIGRTINYYLSNAGISTTYTAHWFGNEDSYRDCILTNILNDHPVVINQKINDFLYYPYDKPSDGHYVVVRGMQFDLSASSYTAVINDPHYKHYGTYYFPISAIYHYADIHADGPFIVYVDE